MIALSIRQPWAWAIVRGGKDIENRSWSTRVRGRVLVHASAYQPRSPDWVDVRDVLRSPGLQMSRGAIDALTGTDERGRVMQPRQPSDGHDLGGIIGSVEIVDCVADSGSPWFFGPWGVVLRDPIHLPFFPCRGRLGFFDVDYPGEVAS